MALTCPGRYTDENTVREIPCQWRHNPEGIHHAHDDTRCIMWTEGAEAINAVAVCPEPPMDEVARRAEELTTKVKARRRTPTVQTGPASWIPPQIWDDTDLPGGLGLYPPHEQRLTDDYTPDWRTVELAEQHLGFIDPNLTVAVQDLWTQNTARGTEIDRLKAELAKSRRNTLFAASELAGSVQADTSADKALRATIVAKLRVAAMADDECAKCGHRRGDHHYGGICKARRSATTHCACRQYGFAAPEEG